MFTFCSSLYTNLFIFSRWEMPNVNNFKFKSVLWLLMGLCSTFFQWCNICPPKSKWDKWTFFIYTGMLLQFFVNLLRNSSQTSKIIITISIQDFIIIYIHSSKSRVNISEDTRLNMTTKEAEEWVETLNKSESFKWKDPNFHTECWHLTLLAHHLSILPCIRRYQRRLRAIRYVEVVVELHWKKVHFSCGPI